MVFISYLHKIGRSLICNKGTFGLIIVYPVLTHTIKISYDLTLNLLIARPFSYSSLLSLGLSQTEKRLLCPRFLQPMMTAYRS